MFFIVSSGRDDFQYFLNSEIIVGDIHKDEDDSGLKLSGVIVDEDVSDFGELELVSDHASDALLFKLSKEGLVKTCLPFLSINSISSSSINSGINFPFSLRSSFY